MTGTSHSDSHPRLWMTSDRSMSAKSAKMTQRSERMPRQEKFFEKALQASSSRNWICDGVGSEDEDAPERRGFWEGADLRLGAIDTTNIIKKREGERERQSEKSQAVQIYQNILNWEYICKEMHEHVTCNIKSIMGLAQSNPTSIQSICTHLNAR